MQVQGHIKRRHAGHRAFSVRKSRAEVDAAVRRRREHDSYRFHHRGIKLRAVHGYSLASHPNLVGNLRSHDSRSLLHVHNESPISDDTFVVLKKMKHHRAEGKSRCQRQQQFD